MPSVFGPLQGNGSECGRITQRQYKALVEAKVDCLVTYVIQSISQLAFW